MAESDTKELRLATAGGYTTRTILCTPVRKATASEIPVIDISPIFSQDLAARHAVAREIHKAAHNNGFFYIKHHGIPAEVIRQAYSACLSFFRQDMEIKTRTNASKPDSFKNGFRGPDTQSLNANEGIDIRESYAIRMPELGPNTHTGLALSLNLTEDFFDDKVKYPEASFGINYYPPLKMDPKRQGSEDTAAQLSIGSHTDWQLFTILWQDNSGGLQVLTRDGQWIHAPPLEGTLVVNVADYMQRMTNDNKTKEETKGIEAKDLSIWTIVPKEPWVRCLIFGSEITGINKAWRADNGERNAIKHQDPTKQYQVAHASYKKPGFTEAVEYGKCSNNTANIPFNPVLIIRSSWYQASLFVGLRCLCAMVLGTAGLLRYQSLGFNNNLAQLARAYTILDYGKSDSPNDSSSHTLKYPRKNRPWDENKASQGQAVHVALVATISGHSKHGATLVPRRGLSDRLPGLIRHVEILPKVMRATNELSCYRYAAMISNHDWMDFVTQRLDRKGIEALLDTMSGPSTLAISNIPYSKIARARAIVESVERPEPDIARYGDWLSRASDNAAHCNSLSPMDLVELAQNSNHRVELSWARQSSQFGGLDAIFYRHDKPDGNAERTLFCFPHDHFDKRYHALSSRPMRQRMEGKILQRLNKSLESLLPRYMLPQSITILDRMPINRNGKVDRRKLAESSKTQCSAEKVKQQPTGPAEQKMQKIWSEVLNIKPNSIGLHDGLIQLGGNSLDAMRVVTLTRQAGMNLSVKDMFRHSTTSIHQLTLQLKPAEEIEPNSVTQKVDPIRLLTDIARYDAKIEAVTLNLDQATRTKDSQKRPTVLLTGANGFIGTQILRQFLEHDQVGRVIAIIRGESAEAEKRSLVDAVRKAQWWTEFHDAILEVWPGDLSMPHLGLEPTKWELVKNGEVDMFVHNAASVYFIKSYDVLKPVNVASTVEMLCVAATSPGTSVARDLAANSNGYIQTKFVSETLVRRAARRTTNGQNQFTIVSPGLVCGTLTEGYLSTDDWIWRLISACIRVGTYNTDNAATWIPMSDVGMIAQTIVATGMRSGSSSQPVVQIKGGLTLGDLWGTLITMGFELQASSGSECAAAIHRDIQSSKEAHPLWTLSDILEDLEDTAQDTWAASWLDGRVHAANGLLNLSGLDGEGKAVLVTAGVVDAVVDPDRPRGLLEVLAVGAGDEAGTAVGQEAILVDLPAVALAVLGHGLSTSGVTELALAHTREINVGLLAREADRVEPELIANKLEGDLVVLLRIVALGVLILEL
ncbi:hypothetical protein HG530_015147 [Fusarium avenaceum]|nr:hypothetical protein HG530_015147 [Fusarium avenaceum]